MIALAAEGYVSFPILGVDARRRSGTENGSLTAAANLGMDKGSRGHSLLTRPHAEAAINCPIAGTEVDTPAPLLLF